MPLQFGNAGNIYEHNAQWIIAQTWQDRLENELKIKWTFASILKVTGKMFSMNFFPWISLKISFSFLSRIVIFKQFLKIHFVVCMSLNKNLISHSWCSTLCFIDSSMSCVKFFLLLFYKKTCERLWLVRYKVKHK